MSNAIYLIRFKHCDVDGTACFFDGCYLAVVWSVDYSSYFHIAMIL